jgi:quinoprotein glucose dehydrogenase
MRKLLIALFLLPGLTAAALVAVPPAESETPYQPKIDAASDAAVKAVKRIQVPKGLQVDLWAAEPMLANPVCMAIDEKNRIYVAETYRLHDGVTDIRGHMDWLDDDLACRSVEDRVAMMKKHVGDKIQDYAVHHDRVRLLEDSSGAGKADKSTVFADGFHHVEDGIGAGLIARNGDVWYTCIPNLWKLRDTKGTGKADEKKSLHRGFGVHVGFLGHDLHGLRFGPDGKLYFSIGDRGLNVTDAEKPVVLPDAGGVLRCNPDGSELEIYAFGLRNPQELAFDERGDLITVDNNSDAGDLVRITYVVQDADCGWRIGYQFGTATGPRGPFMAEDLYKPQWDGQAAYITPPIANLADGPSGLTHDPGVSTLPEKYAGRFFFADFRGAPGDSGVRSFALKPKGATFELGDNDKFVWSVLATDVDFGMDGCLYVLDWVEGWNKPNKGRIYKVFDPEKVKDPAVLEVKKLMAEGFDQRPAEELVKLLDHKDQRVRQSAQFALVDKGGESVGAFAGVAHDGKGLARLHAVWGLGQLGRQKPAANKELIPLLKDADADVRGQATKTLGENRVPAAADALIPLLKDEQPRVRFFAAQALGKLGVKNAIGPVLDMLRANNDKDAYLRHAGVMALVGAGDKAAWMAAADDPCPAVRTAVLLTLRRTNDPDVARFLDDAELAIVLEAARAINDVPIEAAFPKLAALLRRPGLSEPLAFRVLNANFRLGGADNAAAVAAFAARPDAPEKLRVEALEELAAWTMPAGRDRIMGLWRPLAPRPPERAADAFRGALAAVFTGPDKVREQAVKTGTKLGVKEVGPVLFDLAADAKQPAPTRVEALQALATLKDGRLDKAIDAALDDAEPRLRAEARRLLARSQPEKALPMLARVLEKGEIVERQAALAVLADLKTPGADELIAKQLDKLLNKESPAEATLDLLEAAARRPAAEVKDRLARFDAARPKDDPLAAYRETLVGGDAERGKRIFYYKSETTCLKCHKVNGEGGDVGPDMKGIGAKQNREYLLESIVYPDKQIAKGYESVLLELKDGRAFSGVLKGEDDKEIRLLTAEGKLLKLAKADIDTRQVGKSAMPEDEIKKLSKSELRDLIEFLAGLKDK